VDPYKILALDETGKASPSHLSDVFLLSGMIISEDSLRSLEVHIKAIKQKFFNDPNIVFHCRDMLRKKGIFSILSDPAIEKGFWEDFIAIIDNPEISIMMAITDKRKTSKVGWNKIAILRKSYSKVVEGFAGAYLSNGYKGKIVAESDPGQDKFLLETHNRLQSFGIPSQGITGAEYRGRLTSVSLVNKLNLDVHIQTADNLAIMGRLFYNLKINKIDVSSLSNRDRLFKDLIDRKLANPINPSAFEILV